MPTAEPTITRPKNQPSWLADQPPALSHGGRGSTSRRLWLAGGVLWLVLKTPMAISREQLRLFSQLFPNNARPVQPVNGRPVRNAQ